MKFALALVAGITQAAKLSTTDWNLTVRDDGTWDMDNQDDDWYTEDSCNSTWNWEEWTELYWRNDCSNEFSSEGECGWVYESPDYVEFWVSCETFEQW